MRLGLYRCHEWSATEKSYFVQVLLIANAVFGVLYAGHLRPILGDPSIWGAAVVTMVTSFS